MPDEMIGVLIFPVIVVIAALIATISTQAGLNERKRRRARRAQRHDLDRERMRLRRHFLEMNPMFEFGGRRRGTTYPTQMQGILDEAIEEALFPPIDEPFMTWLERKYIGEFKLSTTPRAQVQPPKAVKSRPHAGDCACPQCHRLRNTSFAHFVSSVERV